MSNHQDGFYCFLKETTLDAHLYHELLNALNEYFVVNCPSGQSGMWSIWYDNGWYEVTTKKRARQSSFIL